MSLHIGAKKSDISEIVIFLRDPLLVKRVSERYLKEPRLVNNLSLALAYTGYYEGTEVTIMACGIGVSSISVYAHELYENYDVKKIILIDSCTGYYKEIELKDLILVEKSYTKSNFALIYGNEDINLCKSSVLLSQKIVNKAHEQGMDLKICTVNTALSFYNTYIDSKIKENFALAEDISSFGLLYVAKKYDKQAAVILATTENKETKESLQSDIIDNIFERCTLLALDSIK